MYEKNEIGSANYLNKSDGQYLPFRVEILPSNSNKIK